MQPLFEASKGDAKRAAACTYVPQPSPVMLGQPSKASGLAASFFQLRSHGSSGSPRASAIVGLSPSLERPSRCGPAEQERGERQPGRRRNRCIYCLQENPDHPGRDCPQNPRNVAGPKAAAPKAPAAKAPPAADGDGGKNGANVEVVPVVVDPYQ